MYKFSEQSLNRLNTCHQDIIEICKELIQMYDFSVLEGHRTLKEQQEHYKAGRSKIDGVNQKSKHQSYPSMAIDIMPYAEGTNAFSGKELDERRFYMMMGMVKAISEILYKEGKITHRVRFGLDWDGDDTFTDQTFHDMPHFELKGI